MYNLVGKFKNILSIVKKNLIDVLDEHGNLTRPGNKPKFSDAEVITLSLLSEALMFDSEHYLFKVLNKNFKTAFPNLIDRSGYNRRRKNLNRLTERVWRSLVKKLAFGEVTFVIDSMPIQICKFSRAKRSRVCRERYETAPDYGFCAAQNQTYFGYKLHGLASLNGIITDFELTKANVADIRLSPGNQISIPWLHNSW